jgi:hypothetical protein
MLITPEFRVSRFLMARQLKKCIAGGSRRQSH